MLNARVCSAAVALCQTPKVRLAVNTPAQAHQKPSICGSMQARDSAHRRWPPVAAAGPGLPQRMARTESEAACCHAELDPGARITDGVPGSQRCTGMLPLSFGEHYRAVNSVKELQS